MFCRGISEMFFFSTWETLVGKISIINFNEIIILLKKIGWNNVIRSGPP